MRYAFAVIADVHGNTWALQAVLADIARRGIQQTVNLGDSVYGSLDPRGTADRLMQEGIPSLCGNQDRIVYAPPAAVMGSADHDFVTRELTEAHLDWLRGQPPTSTFGEVFCCHGTPASDETYLLEEVTPYGVRLRDPRAILELLDGVTQPVVVCGHSHVPHAVRLPSGQLVVNPGSVGIPAYDHDEPYPHVMEAGSPHARYAVLRQEPGGWQVEHVAVPYPWGEAAAVARRNGREDRARWIATGRAIP
ncbi:MAG TPA: metallophosphoesterase family protein [Thermoanaerobaculia bacterium]|nr:metallophosphoesterase family protein [Thermoanaerobaculia bacterium]